MKRYILIFTAVIAVATLRAQSDATFSRIRETYTLHDDGSMDYNHYRELKYNTQFAFFRLFGETFVVYNPEFQKLVINDCRTVQKDGTVVTAPENAFNEVLPAAAADAPAYNALREMVITHTGLETDAKVFLDYTLHTDAGAVPSLDIDRILPVQGADIKEYTIVVNVPSGTELRWSLDGSKVKPRVSGNTYTWTFRNIPVASGEFYTPYNHNGMPRLSVTSAPSLAASLAPLTVETREICRVPGRVLEGCDSDEEKVSAVQRFIVREIAGCGVTPDLSGYRIRQCGEVLRTAYGTEAEKAFAMARLLRAEGLNADVVLRFPANVGVLTPKNVTGYFVRCGGKYYSVLSEGEYNAALRADRDKLCDMAGNVLEQQGTTVEIKYAADVRLTADKIETDVKKASVSGMDGKIVASEPVRMRRNGDYGIYTIPATAIGVDAWRMSILNSARRESFEIPYAVNESYDYEISLDGVASKTADVKVDVANSAGRVKITIENRDGKVIVLRSIELSKTIVPASGYNDLKRLLLLWINPAYRQVVVR